MDRSRSNQDQSAHRLDRRTFLGAGLAVAAGAAVVSTVGLPTAEAETEAGAQNGASHAIGSRPVKTQSGLVSGVPAKLPGVTVFKGLPYAASTAGANRWRAPQPAPTWRGVREANVFGPACPQPVQGIPADQVPEMSEDCLNLNVWTGAKHSSERRPVWVWLYGGRNSAMWTSQPIYDGAGLARKGLVVITVNYRVDAFGGLSTAELSAETGHDSSGNWALLDQIAALKWVKNNITAFGGDPHRVTLAGWSHGAASTYDLIDSPLAKGLFHRAQLESGVEYTKDPAYGHVASGYITQAHAEQNGAAFAQAVGASTLAELRALPATTIADAVTNQAIPEFRYVLDNWVMPKSFADTLRTRSQNDVPVLTGNNKDENGVSLTPNVTLTQYRANAQTMFGSLAEQYLALYPASTDTQANDQSNNFDRDYERVSTFLWGTQWLRAGKNPAFTYYWTHSAPGTDTSSPIAAGIQDAGHGSEMNYIFNNLYATNRPFVERDYDIADTLSSYVANFAATGNPNGQHGYSNPSIKRELPHWPALQMGKPVVMEVGDAFRSISAADSDEKFAFIKDWLNSQTINW